MCTTEILERGSAEDLSSRISVVYERERWLNRFVARFSSSGQVLETTGEPNSGVC